MKMRVKMNWLCAISNTEATFDPEFMKELSSIEAELKCLSIV